MQEVDKGRMWIPFSLEYDIEQGSEILQGSLPDNEQEILVTDGRAVWMDTFMRDENGCWLDCSNSDFINEVIAWQPLPEPYKRRTLSET